ncbi:DUF499 domain-containing protein [Candidatus Methanodesulfokora washburnensis]|uniref:ATP-binding protein n=1 Tax=Candidatus Methanodesulfokora washburnensis TaxID=2478471 RepID=A0A3R9PTN0_9CREN|nr:DUF499 domain-containing protein [Candidatus Methanodesulfokores washburnensis]RSN72765.1 ATP-binding protein [Candidatus Methanodesulfokores washburnensis]
MRVWEICHPHLEVVEGKLREDDFVVNVGAVWERLELGIEQIHVNERYIDPNKFVSRTYFTGNMRDLISTIAKRLRGINVQPIHHLKVAMGGGKSHTLLLLYYMVKRRDIRSILEKEGIDASIPEDSRVIVIDGQRIDPVIGYEPLQVKTIWALLLKLLGYAEYKKYDNWDAAPSVPVLREALSHKPTLILIDELSNYAENVKSDENKAGKLQVFLQTLMTAVQESENSALVLVTPIGAFESGFKLVENILNKYAKPSILAREEEYKSIRKRALFQDDFSLLTENIMEISRSFCEIIKRIFPDMPYNCEKLFQDNYPFHPAVDSVMMKLKSSKSFQEVRDELRFLAGLVYSVYKERPNDAYAITVGHANLRDDYVRGGTITKLKDPLLVAKVDGDLSRMEQIEDKFLRSLAEKVYSVIVLNSLVGEPSKLGASQDDIIFSLATPDIAPDLIKNAIKFIEKYSWFVNSRDGRWVFGEPNLMQVLNEYLNKVDRIPELKKEATNLIQEKVEKALKVAWDSYRKDISVDGRIFSDKGIKIWPSRPGEVEDDPKPKLVVLGYISPEESPVAAETKDEAISIAREFYETYENSPRTYKNTMFFLVAHKKLLDKSDPLMHAKAVIAYSEMEKDKKELERSIGSKGVESIGELKKDEENALYRSSFPVYRFLVFPSEGGLSVVELGEEVINEGKLLLEIDRKLKDEVKKVIRKIDPKALIDRYWPAGKGKLEFKELRDSFFRRPELELPINEDVIKEAVREAVKNGLLVLYRENKPVYKEYPKAINSDDILDKEIEKVELKIIAKSELGEERIKVKVDDSWFETPFKLEGLKEEEKELILEIPESYIFKGWSDGSKEGRKKIKLEKNGELVILLGKKEEIPPEKALLTITAKDKKRKEHNIDIKINGEKYRTPVQLKFERGEKVIVEVLPLDTDSLEFDGWSDGQRDEKREFTIQDDLSLTITLKSAKPSTRSVSVVAEFKDAFNKIKSYEDKEITGISLKFLNIPPEEAPKVVNILSMLFNKDYSFTASLNWKNEDISISTNAEGERSSFGVFKNYMNQISEYINEFKLEMSARFSDPLPLSDAILFDALKGLQKFTGYIQARLTIFEKEGRALKELTDEFIVERGEKA